MQFRTKPTPLFSRMATLLAHFHPRSPLSSEKPVHTLLSLGSLIPACQKARVSRIILFPSYSGRIPLSSRAMKAMNRSLAPISPLSFLFFRMLKGPRVQHVSLFYGISTVSDIFHCVFNEGLQPILRSFFTVAACVYDSWKRNS